MRLIFVANFLPDTNYTRDLSQGFIQIIKKSDEIFLCGRVDEPVVDGKIPKVDLVWKRNAFFFIPILLYIFKKRPDLVHFQQEFKMYGGIISALILPWFILFIRLFGIRIVITSHGIVSTKQLNKDFLESFGLSYNLLNKTLVIIFLNYSYKLLVGFSNKLTVHSPFLKEILIDEYGCSPNKVMVIEHGIRDLPNVARVVKDPSIAKRFPVLKNQDVILVFGHFSPRKGLEFLIKSFYKMVSEKNKKKWVMVLAGDVSPEFYQYRRKIDRLIKKLNASKFILITGFVNAKEVDELYRMAKVSVIPAIFSFNTSGALSLSLAYKKPLLVSDVRPIADEIRSNNIGRLFDIMSINSLGDELNNLLMYKNYRKVMHSVNKVAERRYWIVIAGQHYKLYKSLLKS